MAVKLLTIGEFARLSRLSPKALRLYDDLGLLRPFRVDAWSGYRYYEPSQLERARLVAWLRRLGMPLAQIGAVVEASPANAVALVTAFLRVTEAEFAERQRLAQFLIGYFSEGATAMSVPSAPASSTSSAPLAIRYAAASDIGLVRAQNQDAVAAGPRLVAVADGFGPAGDLASAAAIDALRDLDSVAPGDLLNVLSDAVSAASASVRSIAPPGGIFDATSDATSGAPSSGSTLTAMLLSGSRLGLVHIGDSRAYLFRDGGLFQITHDHSVTQSMIDAGRLTPEEAGSHPQRSLLVRALGISAELMRESGMPEAQVSEAGTADLSLLDARAGDRYLLCSDGLTAAVPVAAIRGTLADAALSPEEVVGRLIALANEAGGPDNIACALADITEAA
ncbi:MerR family transcriptional regulator [Trebonia kvetii]|uniref:MerR family transcriptional regulator n=1 Tax=Trebonia kvetii TaxID=2480626 RepID=UPI001C9E6D90|nr:MerR family transcriptional regulator [Trebonia kvetii]